VQPPLFFGGQTLFWHGVYLAAAALPLFLAPGFLRLILPFAAELDWWNRMLAIPLFNQGVLCIAAGRTGSRPLLQLSVAMRLWVMAVLAVLVAVRLAPVVVLVGLIDLASAVLTLWALRAESRQRLQPERQDRRGRRATRV
jgi:hypothetical protein